MIRNSVKVALCVVLFALRSGPAWADGAVYAMTNALGNNQVMVYHRNADGNLITAPVQTINTGGGGSGLQLAGVDSLGSAGSLKLDLGNHLLFAINTESARENNGAGTYHSDCQQGTITSFQVAADGTLTFADRVFSRGLFPDSLAVKRLRGSDLLYVLNAGGPETAVCNNQPAVSNQPNITAFVVDRIGRMEPLGSVQPIDPGPATGPSGGESCSPDSAAGFSALTGAPAADFQCGLNPPSFVRSPAQIGFTPAGKDLVVTVKGTNTIYVFPVNAAGNAGNPTIMQASLPAIPGYFGFAFDRKQALLVTEQWGSSTSIPRGGAGALSSFSLNKASELVPVSSSVDDGGTAACWIALEPIAANFAYVSNNLSASISSYSVASNGVVTLLDGTAASGAGPNDLATAAESGASFLYALEAGSGAVGAFEINSDGSLTSLAGGAGLPAGRSAQGLAAY